MEEDAIEPVIGQWYRDEARRIFEVVAMDDECIEIQFQDGDVEEVDAYLWPELEVVPVAEPNDGSGPFDLVDDEYARMAEDYQPANW